jgi:hypothetical protein
MGTIKRFDIMNLIKKYDLKNYVETGTGMGECLEFAMRHPFKRFYSIEIYEEIHNKVQEKFKNISKMYNRECNILLGNSFEMLPEILSKIENKGNTLFFLDAHFPGADFGHQLHGDEKNLDQIIPLNMEMRTIIKNRDISKDVFIADDLRIYEDGPFASGNWPDRELYGGDGIGFIENLFMGTHTINRDYRDQGYVVLSPQHDTEDIEKEN